MEEWTEIYEEGTRRYRMRGLPEEGDNYRYHMLTENTIPGLLPVRIREKNGKRAIAFDISSKTSLKTICSWGSLRAEQLYQLVTGLERIFRNAEDYLLEPDCFLLSPEEIYVEPEGFSVFLCCMPGVAGDWRRAMRELLRFLLEKIDYREETVVQLAYELYHISSLDNGTIEDLGRCARNIFGDRELLEELPGRELDFGRELTEAAEGELSEEKTGGEDWGRAEGEVTRAPGKKRTVPGQ